MYVRVPEHLQPPLLKELQQNRRRYALKAFPLAVLFISGLAALVFFVKGQLVIEEVRRLFHLDWSERQIVVGGLVLSVVVGVVLAGLFVWQKCKECQFEESLYCSKCNAVDKYDSGACPICQSELTERVACFSTTDKEEEKTLERWGLQACKESQQPLMDR